MSEKKQSKKPKASRSLSSLSRERKRQLDLVAPILTSAERRAIALSAERRHRLAAEELAAQAQAEMESKQSRLAEIARLDQISSNLTPANRDRLNRADRTLQQFMIRDVAAIVREYSLNSSSNSELQDQAFRDFTRTFSQQMLQYPPGWRALRRSARWEAKVVEPFNWNLVNHRVNGICPVGARILVVLAGEDLVIESWVGGNRISTETLIAPTSDNVFRILDRIYRYLTPIQLVR